MYEDKEEIVVIEVKVSADDHKMLSTTAQSFCGDYDESESVNSVHQKNTCENDPSDTEKDRLVQILDFLGSKIIVTHDNGFEIFYVNDECDDLKIGRFANTVIDTRKLAQLVHPKSPSFELNYLIFEVYGITAPLCYMEKVALIYFNLLEDSKKKGIDIYKAAIFSDDTIAD